MTSAQDNNHEAQIKALAQAAAAAADDQLREVVRTVDALSARGRADALIAPLRPRLAEIQVAHKLRFARLLFLPLDALIVPAARWKPSDNTLPRSIVLPLVHVVEAAIGKQAAEIKARIRAHTTADTDVIEAVGPPLWRDAAEILARPDLTMNEQWRHTAMSERMFHAMRYQVASLLRQAPALDTLVRETASGLVPPDPWAISAMARTVSTECPDALVKFAVMLVTRHAGAASVLHELGTNRSVVSLRKASEEAAQFLLDRMEDSGTTVPHKDLAAFTASMRRLATMLNELDHDMMSRVRRDQIRVLRGRLDHDCQVRLRDSVTHDFVAHLHAALADDTELAIEKLEDTARTLRVLEIVGRSLGSPSVYQAIITPAVEALEALPPVAGTALVHRVRLLEIMAGSERAMALLERDYCPVNENP